MQVSVSSKFSDDHSYFQDQLAPRKLSLSGPQPLASPVQPSPRTRYFDGVLNGGEAWMARRRASEGLLKGGTVREPSGDDGDNSGMKIKEEDETAQEVDPGPAQLHIETLPTDSTEGQSGLENGTVQLHLDTPVSTTVPTGPPPGLDLASIEWSYLDPQGQVQGTYTSLQSLDTLFNFIQVLFVLI